MIVDYRLAWLAGIIDGEGCISVLKSQNAYKYRLSIVNTDENLLQECRDIISEITDGHVTEYISKGNDKWRDRTYLQLCKKSTILHVLAAVYPYLISKRRQAKIVMKFCLRSKTSYSVVEDDMYDEIKQLNKRGRRTEVKQMKKSLYTTPSLSSFGGDFKWR